MVSLEREVSQCPFSTNQLRLRSARVLDNKIWCRFEADVRSSADEMVKTLYDAPIDLLGNAKSQP